MAKFRRNPGFEAQLRATPGYRRAVADAAEPARDRAERFAEAAGGPWMPRRKSGTNKTIIIDVSGPTPRIVNIDHAGHLLEWGSKNNPPHAPLRRGVRAAGLRLSEHDKT